MNYLGYINLIIWITGLFLVLAFLGEEIWVISMSGFVKGSDFVIVH